MLPVLKALRGKYPGTRHGHHFDQADKVMGRLSGLGMDFLIAIFLFLVRSPWVFRAASIVMLSFRRSLAIGLVLLNYGDQLTSIEYCWLGMH